MEKRNQICSMLINGPIAGQDSKDEITFYSYSTIVLYCTVGLQTESVGE